MRLPSLGHVICWSNRVVVNTMWQLHFIKYLTMWEHIQECKKSPVSQSSFSFGKIVVFGKNSLLDNLIVLLFGV